MFCRINFQKRMFIYYSFIVGLIITIMGTSFYFYLSNILKDRTLASMENIVGNLSSQLDLVIKQMDTISLQVEYSKDVQEMMQQALDYDEEHNYFDENYDLASKLRNILVSINSTKVLARRICLFNNRNNYVSVGTVSQDPKMIDYSIKNAKWIKSVIGRNGKYIILPPHRDDWLPISSTGNNLVISLARSIIASYGAYNYEGIAEIQQPYDNIENICKIDKNLKMQIIVINESGDLIYPFGGMDRDAVAHYYKTVDKIRGANYIILKNTLTGKEELIYGNVSSYTGWTVMLVQKKSDYLAPVIFMQRMIFIFGSILILLTLLIIFFINRNLTLPVRQLKSSINKISLDNLVLGMELEVENDEFTQLNHAFEKMLIRLKESINQTMQARTMELRSRLLALQAQINPHFIHNTLMGISAIGYDLGSQEIMSMCSDISAMLRYIASSESVNASMRDEIRHAESYLKLMKCRYKNRLSYSFNIEEAMNDIKVPKLVIQPIIENCFSHGLQNTKPPWIIDIHGYINDGYWYVDISDNGSGFDEETEQAIYKRIQKYKYEMLTGSSITKLEIGGMGVVNIYMRLFLLYGENAIFEILKKPTGGSAVRIGGTTDLSNCEVLF